jgi:hypothetical protein
MEFISLFIPSGLNFSQKRSVTDLTGDNLFFALYPMLFTRNPQRATRNPLSYAFNSFFFSLFSLL